MFVHLKKEIFGILKVKDGNERALSSAMNALLKKFKILDKEGIKVISSIFFNPELAVNVGTYTKLKPSAEDNKSIKKAIKMFSNEKKRSFSKKTIFI